METKKANDSQEQKTLAPDFSSPFILKGKTLLVKINGQPIEKPVPKTFKSVKELEELVYDNSKILFGEKTFFVEIKSSIKEEHVISSFLLDLKNPEKPLFYIVEVFHSKQNFSGYVLPLTKIFSILRSKDDRKKFADLITGYIYRTKLLKKEFKGGDVNKPIGLIHDIITRKPAILLIADNELPGVSAFMETYRETWGEMLKPVLLRKFSSSGEIIITMHPGFAEIQNGKVKSNSSKEKINYTEDYHMEDVADDVKTVYEKMKSELLKTDKTLQFNPQKYYISMRKNRNLAFFHFSKKKISLVVMNPDKATRKVIKHHEVKTLTEKVQKFWNGASCTIVVESMKNLSEVISLLKKLVAGA